MPPISAAAPCDGRQRHIIVSCRESRESVLMSTTFSLVV